MFCSNCGIENADGATFCKNCGMKMGTVSAPQAAPVYAAPVRPVKAPLSSHPVLNAIKKVASSPLFLVAIIAYSVQILGAIIGSATAGGMIQNVLYRVLYEFGGDIPYEVYEIIDNMAMAGRGSAIVGTIIGLIPTMIICAGLWITYASARSRLSNGMKTSGLTMIKVITIIQLIGSCIAVAAIEILLLLAVIGVAATEYAPGVAIAILVFLVLIVAAVYVLQIIYSAKIIKSINTAKSSITTGAPSDKVSGFVAVWAFVSAAGFLFSLFTNFLSSAASMTALICFGILIFKYKSEMRALMYAPQNTINPTI